MTNKRVVILGGGTMYHVRPHLALVAPAYGAVVSDIKSLIERELTGHQHVPASYPGIYKDMLIDTYYSSMASCGDGDFETNEDLAALTDRLVDDLNVKIIFFAAAVCDFRGHVDAVGLEGKYGTRLESRNLKSNDEATIKLSPDTKIIDRIRKQRKDIFLVAFKTTCGATEKEQYLAGLKLLKGASANLVLANDTKTRLNMVITPEEAKYHVTTDRQDALRGLVEMAGLRSQLTFTRSTVVAGEPVPWNSDLVPQNLRDVVNYCIQKGAYKPFNGATVGHFAAKLSPTEFLTSRRKTNFNDIETLGLVKVVTDKEDSVIAYGAKPSVGGQSQRIVFEEHPGMDCIVHFHCPIKPGSDVPVVSQREYECGSHQCGQNTSQGLKKYQSSTFTVGTDGETVYTFYAVYLDQHGPNIVFSKDTPSWVIIEFIFDHFDLSAKTGGPVSG